MKLHLSFEQVPGYERPPHILIRIAQGLREACIIIAIVCWAAAVACWDTIFAGKDESEQIGGGK